MINRFQECFRFFRGLNIGFVLVFSVTGLTLLGLVVLASASQSFMRDSYYVFNKQLIWLFFAIIGGIVASFVDLERVRWLSWVVLGVSVVLLLLVLIPGVGIRVNGAQRWLGLGPMRLQVSDVARLGLILGLSRYLAVNQRHIKSFVKGFVMPSAMIGVICLLVIVEPDFGTAFLCGSVGLGMLFLAGVRLFYLLPSLLGGGLLFSIAIWMNPIRLKRLTSFLDVEGNKSDGAYQLWQGILAFAAGGVGGVGLGSGRQQMSFLPEAHTDFIFPIIGEEMGLFFTSGVVVLFLIIFLVGYRILRCAPDIFYFSMVAGALLFIVMQALINIGVVTGLLPTKGMSLPFISYGGSNLVLMFVLVGLLLNCLRTWSSEPLVKAREL